ncbi:hypothetical protein THASP1DRAFT_29177 [Thamnocephalis sphaerospora]|uniref:Uncharacterized protein n=1 Tax=Thamnocephalis sphaerospora TaxID=78915 RepID=A0A4P9XSE3_9FUNG|nr:hypothetical protein THASP1DRAFT_29177 [Thamnocephalis sphaerospora]|eukprot:RKP09026.1 hypothetical protein THASP1DRAFT_29177 [Thamnocephalis sphaerospora]
MAKVGGNVPTAEGLVEAERSIRNAHISLDLDIANRPDSGIKIIRHTYYAADGACTTLPDVIVEAGSTTKAVFKAVDNKHRLKGCLLYQIVRADAAPSSANDLYLLLAWRIKPGGNAYMMLDLLENRKGVIVWDTRRLESHYKEYIREQLQTTKSAQTRTWAMDNDSAFTVRVNMNDACIGSMKVDIIKAESPLDEKRPFFVSPQRCDTISWSTIDGTSAYNNPSVSYLFGSSVDISVHNNCDNLLLCNPSISVLKGKHKSDSLRDITPHEDRVIKLKSASMIRGRTHGCIVYELVEFSGLAPVIWNRRTFLVIDVITVPNAAEKRKVAVQLFTALGPSFSAANDGLPEKAHRDVFCQYMTTHGRPFTYRMDKMNLKLDLSFDRERHARLYVRLSQVSRCPQEDKPLFFAVEKICAPSSSVLEAIQNALRNLDKHLHHRLRLCENKTNGPRGEKNGFILEQLYPDKEESFKEFHIGCTNSRLRSGEAYLHGLPVPKDKQSDLYIHMIEPVAHFDDGFVCLLVLMQNMDASLVNSTSDSSKPPIQGYTALILYTPKHKGEDATDLVKYLLTYAKMPPNSSYDAGHLMDREIQFPGEKAHLCVYQAAAPPHVLAVSLENSLGHNALHAKQSNHFAHWNSSNYRMSKDSYPTAPPPRSIRISVLNVHAGLKLRLIDYIASGVPVNNISSQAVSHGSEFAAYFEFSAQDCRSTVLLRFVFDNEASIGMDVQIDLELPSFSENGNKAQQTTIIRYVDSNNCTVAGMKPHRLDTVYNIAPDGSDDNSDQPEICTNCSLMARQAQSHMPTIPAYAVAIRHGCRSNSLLNFDACVTIAESA